jgi:hypothetical protein
MNVTRSLLDDIKTDNFNGMDMFKEWEREGYHIHGAPCKARNVNVVYIYIYIYIYMYGPMFGNAESRLFLFAAPSFKTESVQKVILWHNCV